MKYVCAATQQICTLMGANSVLTETVGAKSLSQKKKTNMDEYKTNENILEQLSLSFDEALLTGNIEQCRKIIAEMKDLSPDDSYALEEALLDMPISNFK